MYKLEFTYRVSVFNATFNHISVISWWLVLLVKETRVTRENLICIVHVLTMFCVKRQLHYQCLFFMICIVCDRGLNFLHSLNFLILVSDCCLTPNKPYFSCIMVLCWFTKTDVVTRDKIKDITVWRNNEITANTVKRRGGRS